MPNWDFQVVLPRLRQVVLLPCHHRLHPHPQVFLGRITILCPLCLRKTRSLEEFLGLPGLEEEAVNNLVGLNPEEANPPAGGARSSLHKSKLLGHRLCLSKTLMMVLMLFGIRDFVNLKNKVLDYVISISTVQI